MKGKTHSEATRRKISEALKGKKCRLGKKHTLETRRKMSETMRKRAARGPACHSYKDGKVAERRGERFSTEYKHWRYDVFVRDNFTCMRCGDDQGGNLEAHHKKSFADYPELRYVVENGETLCKDCHDKEHGYRKLAWEDLNLQPPGSEPGALSSCATGQ